MHFSRSLIMRLQIVILIKTVALPCLLLLTCFELARHSTNVCNIGAVIVSPSPMATVCNAGEMLEVNCTTNTSSILIWNLMYISENGMVEQVEDIIISSTAMTRPIRTISSSVISFVRRSKLMSTPLTSSVMVGSVSLGLNGTRITCRESVGTTRPGATTTIYIIPAYDLAESLNNIIMIVDSEGFGKDGVTVNLQWSNHDNPRISFNISTTPVVQPIISMTGATFTVAYNTIYNVSVVATVSGTACDRTSFIPLHYTKCVHPLDPSWASVRDHRIDDFLVVTGYTDPAVEGASVNLTCSVGVITGSTTTTCMQNGEWEPDPTIVMCIPKGSTSDSEMIPTLSDSVYDGNPEFNYTVDPEHSEATPSINLNTIGISIGLGVAVVVCITLLTIGILLKWKDKWKATKRVKHSQGDCNPQIESSEVTNWHQTGVVYADVDLSSYNKHKPPNMEAISVELDDTHVEYARINHHILNDDTQLQSTMLNADIPRIDLDMVLIQLRPQVGPKWYQFGEAAGIDKKVLDNYASNCAPEDCIVEVLDCWLRNFAGQPTWKDVASVLRSISLHQLALEIENVYSTGRLPIEMDVNDIIISPLQPGIIPPVEEDNKVLPPPLPPKMFELIVSDIDVLPRPPKMKETKEAESDTPRDQKLKKTVPSSEAPLRPPKP